jgi:amidophosphoribosyltransferase
VCKNSHIFDSKLTHSYSNPHIYGIDLASPKDMVAHGRDNASICKVLGAEHIAFQTMDDLTKAVREVGESEGLKEPQKFEVGVFNGDYATSVPEGYLSHLEDIRSKL